jgi:hypothetical protein
MFNPSIRAWPMAGFTEETVPFTNIVLDPGT